MVVIKYVFKFVLSALVVLLLTNGLLAQNRFDGALILGLNASQIDGDDLAGYDKLGLTGGVKLDYALKDPWAISLELIYSQRGSQSELVPDSGFPLIKINLQYIEIPLLARYKDWWIEEDEYFKVDVEAGLSYGYLFRSTNSQGSYTWGTEDLNQHDVSLIFGANYFINKHWGFGVRYTRSIVRLYVDPQTRYDDLWGYFLSFRSYFQF